jgi:hypothetical protein
MLKTILLDHLINIKFFTTLHIFSRKSINLREKQAAIALYL